MLNYKEFICQKALGLINRKTSCDIIRNTTDTKLIEWAINHKTWIPVITNNIIPIQLRIRCFLALEKHWRAVLYVDFKDNNFYFVTNKDRIQAIKMINPIRLTNTYDMAQARGRISLYKIPNSPCLNTVHKNNITKPVGNHDR